MKNSTQAEKQTRARRTSLAASTIAFALSMTVAALGQAAGSASGTSGSGSSAAGTTRSGGTTTSTGATSTGATTAGQTDSETREFLQKAAKSGIKEVSLSQLAGQRASDPAVRDYAQMLVSEHQQANSRLTSLAQARGVPLPSHGMAAASSSMGATTTTDAQSGASSRASTDANVASTPRATAGGQGGTQAPAGGSHSARAGTGAGHGESAEAMRDIDAAAKKLTEKSGADFDRAYVEQMIKDHKDAIELFEDASKQTADREVSSFAQSTLPKLRGHLSRAEALAQQVKR